MYLPQTYSYYCVNKARDVRSNTLMLLLLTATIFSDFFSELDLPTMKFSDFRKLKTLAIPCAPAFNVHMAKMELNV